MNKWQGHATWNNILEILNNIIMEIDTLIIGISALFSLKCCKGKIKRLSHDLAVTIVS